MDRKLWPTLETEDEELHSRKKRKKNRKGKLNENTVNKAFRMGADSGTKPKDRESGQRKRKWK